MAVEFNPVVNGQRSPLTGSGSTTAQQPATPGPTALQRQADQTDFLKNSVALRDSLVELDTLLSNVRRRPSRAAVASSGAALGLTDLTRTQAVRVSSGEANTITTSFSPTAPAWSGLSSADPGIGGLYDGSDGSGTLTFRAANSGIHGFNNINLEVLRPDNSVRETVVVAAGDPIDQVYTLSNGLTLTLGSGNVIFGDTFTVDVLHDLDEAPDPDKPFNGAGADAPNFQPGVAVVAGSFDVNGVTITVDADDTINAVVAKITGSAADVTASYDADAELLTLTRNTPGSANTIDLTNDTTGFFAALNMEPGIFTAGTDSDLDLSIDSVGAFAGIATGTFSINGVAISVDVANDSFGDLLNRINAADTGARARLVSGSQRLQIENLQKNTELVLDDGTSGFFSAVGIAPETFAATVGGLSKKAVSLINESLRELATNVQDVFADEQTLGLAATDAEKLRGQLTAVVEDVGLAVADGEKPRFIVDFDFADPESAFDVDPLERRSFNRRLDRFYTDFRNVLAGTRDAPGNGLLDRLIKVLDTRINGLSASLGSQGVFIDSFV